MRAFLEAFDRWIMRLLGWIIIFTNLAITCLILFLVLARYVLGWSVVGVLELATLSAMWLYMCGAVVATRNKEHLVVDFLSLSMNSTRAKAVHSLLVSIIMVVLSMFFLSLARDMVIWSLKRPQTTAALSLPLLIPQSAIIVAAVLCAVYAVRDVIVSGIVLMRPDRSGAGEV